MKQPDRTLVCPIWGEGRHLSAGIGGFNRIFPRRSRLSGAAAVAGAVWSLYRRALARIGPAPTLIEWDNNLPDFSVLATEVARAKTALLAEANRPMLRNAA